ncbi:MAG: endonuclease/exonuclease/phosphatase family protein [Planctomycetota bacterium]
MTCRTCPKCSFGNPGIPVVLVGDLNLPPWSPHFDSFLSKSELLNGSSEKGLQPTWSFRDAFPFGLIIDHGPYRRELLCTTPEILKETGSDRRPVVFKFRR